MEYPVFPDNISLMGARWRVLGIDVGTVRIGVAISDPDRILASPVETINRVTDLTACERLAQIIFEYEPQAIVFGLPYDLSGNAGIAVANTHKFITEIRNYFREKNISIEFYAIDERLTTALAHQQLRQVGHNSRSSRAIIDQVAAIAILQTWLERYRAFSGRDGSSCRYTENVSDDT